MVQLIIPLLPTTVKPPIADLPRQGHNTVDLPTTDTFEGHKYNYWLPYSFSTRFEPAKRGQPLYKGHNRCIYTVSAFFVWRLYLLCSYTKRGIKLGKLYLQASKLIILYALGSIQSFKTCIVPMQARGTLRDIPGAVSVISEHTNKQDQQQCQPLTLAIPRSYPFTLNKGHFLLWASTVQAPSGRQRENNCSQE